MSSPISPRTPDSTDDDDDGHVPPLVPPSAAPAGKVEQPVKKLSANVAAAVVVIDDDDEEEEQEQEEEREEEGQAATAAAAAAAVESSSVLGSTSHFFNASSSSSSSSSAAAAGSSSSASASHRRRTSLSGKDFVSEAYLAEQTQALRRLRGKQVPETIVFCVDVGEEMKTVVKGTKLSRLHAVRDCIASFVQVKMSMGVPHRFGLVELGKDAAWLMQPSSDANDFFQMLYGLHPTDGVRETPAMEPIVDMAHALLVQSSTPIVRVVLVYGRSKSPLVLNPSAAPSFFRKIEDVRLCLDVLFIHKPSKECPQAQQVFDSLLQLDTTRRSAYLVSCTDRSRVIARCMSFLLAHPLQRKKQRKQKASLVAS